MIVEVTQDHINRGVPTVCKCPVALAIMEEGRKVKYGLCAAVRTTNVRLWHLRESPPMKTVQLPPEAAQFIRDFDSKKPVQPFSFELGVDL